MATRLWLVTFYLFSFIRKSIRNNLFRFYVTTCKFYTQFGTSRNFQNKGLNCYTFNSKNVVHFQSLQSHHMFYDTHISFKLVTHICIDCLDIEQMLPPQIIIYGKRLFLVFCLKKLLRIKYFVIFVIQWKIQICSFVHRVFIKNFLVLSRCSLLLLFEWSHRLLEQSGFWWSIMTLDFPNKTFLGIASINFFALFFLRISVLSSISANQLYHFLLQNLKI